MKPYIFTELLIKYVNAEYLAEIRLVDDEILAILRQRYEDCSWYYGIADRDKFCADLYTAYQDAAGAWFTKCMKIYIYTHTHTHVHVHI